MMSVSWIVFFFLLLIQQSRANARNARKKTEPNEMNTMIMTVGLLSGDGEGGSGGGGGRT